MVKLALLMVAVPLMAQAAPWPAEEMPLQLPVRTPEDIAFKAEAERQYLEFNLFVSGKLAFDKGDYATALNKWNALLRLPDVNPQVERALAPFLARARKATGEPAPATTPSRDAPAAAAPAAAPPVAPAATRVSIGGVVSGGGAIGPGGAVLWLKRLDRPTPTPRPGRPRVISQKNKVFSPRVLAVPMGTRVEFRNDDDFYHNVFALGRAAQFDTGLYPAGESYGKVFDKPGPVELLCNIHATMVGFVYVVDSPYYTQPAASGTFTIRNVPPGQYELHAWHEAAVAPVRQKLVVTEKGAPRLTVEIPAEKRPSSTVPDKYGRPRHLQLGY